MKFYGFVDRGHRYSNGSSEVSFYIRHFKNVHPETQIFHPLQDYTEQVAEAPVDRDASVEVVNELSLNDKLALCDHLDDADSLNGEIAKIMIDGLIQSRCVAILSMLEPRFSKPEFDRAGFRRQLDAGREDEIIALLLEDSCDTVRSQCLNLADAQFIGDHRNAIRAFISEVPNLEDQMLQPMIASLRNRMDSDTHQVADTHVEV